MLSKFKRCCQNWYWSWLYFYNKFCSDSKFKVFWSKTPHLTEEHTHQFRWLNSLMSGWSDEPNGPTFSAVQRNWCCDFVLELLDSYLTSPLKQPETSHLKATCFYLGDLGALQSFQFLQSLLRNWADLKRYCLWRGATLKTTRRDWRWYHSIVTDGDKSQLDKLNITKYISKQWFCSSANVFPVLSFVFKYFSKHCTQSKVLLMFSATVATLHPVISGASKPRFANRKWFKDVPSCGAGREHYWNTIGTLEITRWDSHKIYDKLRKSLQLKGKALALILFDIWDWMMSYWLNLHFPAEATHIEVWRSSETFFCFLIKTDRMV